MKSILIFFLISIYSTSTLAQDKNYSEWYLLRGDVNIYVKEFGIGKDTVVVVHGGFGANHKYMEDALKGLKNKFHFILYDQRGSLLSPTKKENLTFQKNVDDLFALVEELKLKKVKLFCHSMGTLIGMEFTKEHPNLVTNLVLAGTVPPKSDSINDVFSKRYDKQISFLQNRKKVKQLLRPFEAEGIDTLKTLEDIKKSKLTDKDLTDYWRIKFASVNIYDIEKYNLVKGGRAYYNPDASRMVESVNWHYDYRSVLNNTKTTIINGSYDFLDFNAENLKRLLKGYRNINIDIIQNAGHLSWIDKPEIFKKYLTRALEN